jgi:hypothetical protein
MAKERFTVERDNLFSSGDDESLWMKYCGFLDLTLEEFMIIQKSLLMDQLETLSHSPLGRMLLPDGKPATLEEFRRETGFTRYKDYEPYLKEGREDLLPFKPVTWAHTSGKTGSVKWVPYSADNLRWLADNTLTAFILASANRKGEVQLRPGARVVLNLPPVPYITGIMARISHQRMAYQAIPPLDLAEKMLFQERIQQGFTQALQTGIDYVSSIAVVLAKVGENFGNLGNSTRISYSTFAPLAILRLLRAIMRAKLARRPLLPKDIWKVKGLVMGGTDSSIYREQIAYYWGVEPLDVYVSTETGFIAMQGWNKNGMSFVPYTNFYEFIPREEYLKAEQDSQYQPRTVLLDEVKADEIYEIVVTNFHGGPFVRYRIGDRVKIVSLKDEKAAISLPQMVFQSRADDIIDIAGFARLDEKIIWRAIQNTGIGYEDWLARKEREEDHSILHLYLELKGEEVSAEEVLRRIDEQLISIDSDYADLRKLTEADPLRVTILEKGSFERYQRRKQARGFDIAHLKPPHMNARDEILDDLRDRVGILR